MFPDHFPTRIDDITSVLRDSLLEKVPHRDLTDETQTLTVFLLCVREMILSCDRSYLSLRHMRERENTFCELSRREASEEV
jgi:hypothetical protein